jgi:hypothetical protein
LLRSLVSLQPRKKPSQKTSSLSSPCPSTPEPTQEILYQKLQCTGVQIYWKIRASVENLSMAQYLPGTIHKSFAPFQHHRHCTQNQLYVHCTALLTHRK